MAFFSVPRDVISRTFTFYQLSEECPGSIHSEECPGSIHSEECPGSIHSEECPGSIHSEECPGSIHAKECPGSIHSKECPGSIHSEECPGSIHVFTLCPGYAHSRGISSFNIQLPLNFKLGRSPAMFTLAPLGSSLLYTFPLYHGHGLVPVLTLSFVGASSSRTISKIVL